MNKLVIRFCFLLILMLAAGCERTETVSPKKSGPEPAAEKTFLIGLIPDQNIFRQTERYQPLADFLSKRVGIKIRLTVLPRYGRHWQHEISGGAHPYTH
jgi:phosphonate transport system substrate-binding protein